MKYLLLSYNSFLSWFYISMWNIALFSYSLFTVLKKRHCNGSNLFSYSVCWDTAFWGQWSVMEEVVNWWKRSLEGPKLNSWTWQCLLSFKSLVGVHFCDYNCLVSLYGCDTKWSSNNVIVTDSESSKTRSKWTLCSTSCAYI